MIVDLVYSLDVLKKQALNSPSHAGENIFADFVRYGRLIGKTGVFKCKIKTNLTPFEKTNLLEQIYPEKSNLRYIIWIIMTNYREIYN